MICPNCGYTDSKKPRSLQQNKAYFGIVVKMIADELGYDKEDMHKALAGKFLGYNEVTIDNSSILIPKSTKNLSTKEFIEYAERIQRWAAEFHGISIPNPKEKTCKQ